MNEIDRSVESMDMALRRRFLWYDIEVNKELLQASLKDILSDYDVEEGAINEIAQNIMRMNEYMCGEGEGDKCKKNKRYVLNKDYYISQGQITGLPEATYKKLQNNQLKEFLDDVWNLRICGILKEYVRGEGDSTDFLHGCYEAMTNPDQKESE